MCNEIPCECVMKLNGRFGMQLRHNRRTFRNAEGRYRGVDEHSSQGKNVAVSRPGSFGGVAVRNKSRVNLPLAGRVRIVINSGKQCRLSSVVEHSFRKAGVQGSNP